jgi:hypothetical protein
MRPTSSHEVSSAYACIALFHALVKNAGLEDDEVLPTSVRFHHREFGFKQSSLNRITQVLQDSAIHVFWQFPLYQHALVPSTFQLQVNWFISESFP